MTNRKPLKHLIFAVFIAALVLFSGLPASIRAQTADPIITSDSSLQADEVQVELSGWLIAVWDDSPESVPALPDFYLKDSAGYAVRLLLNETLIQSIGGFRRLLGQHVVARGTWIAIPRSAGDRSSLEVQSLSLETPANDSITSSASTTIAGPQPWLSILCKFADIPGEPRPVSFFEGMMGNNYPGMDHYWRQTSYNTINLLGSTIAGWYTLPHPKSHYLHGNPPEWDIYAFANDCIAEADVDVHFPSYYGINVMANDFISPDALGGCCWYLDTDGSEKSYGITWMAQGAYDHQSIVAHEMGHGFALLHSGGAGYAYNSPWDVMAYIYYEPKDPVYGYVAQGMISYHKDVLGWIPPQRKYVSPFNSEATITLEQLTLPQTNHYLMAQIPTCTAADRFYTVEARRFTGYDVILPGEAVIIHGVDTSGWRDPADVVDGDKNGNTSDAGVMWLPGETFVDPANGIAVAVNSATPTGFTITVENNPPPGCSSNGILLCDQITFTGECVSITGNDPELSNNLPVFDNQAVSLRFAGSYTTGWQISLFEHPGYSGAYTNFRFNDSDLADNWIGQDRASSIRIWQDNNDGRWLTNGELFQGMIHNHHDTDVYNFYGTQGQIVTIRMSETSGGTLNSYLRLFSPNGNMLVEDNNRAGNLNAQISNFVLPATGYYRVVAKSAYNISAGSYTITRRLLPGADCNPPPNGVILYDGPNFTGSCITLTASNPDLLLANFDDRAGSIRFVGSYANGGWQVTLFRHTAYSGPYNNFRFSDPDLGNNGIGQDQTSSIRIWQDSDDGRTILSNQRRNGTIHFRTDTDLYTFAGTQGQVVTISMTRQNNTLNSFLTLYGPNWGLLTQDNDSGGNTNALINGFVLPSNGVYRIMAKSYNAGSSGPYRLSMVLE